MTQSSPTKITNGQRVLNTTVVGLVPLRAVNSNAKRFGPKDHLRDRCPKFI